MLSVCSAFCRVLGPAFHCVLHYTVFCILLRSASPASAFYCVLGPCVPLRSGFAAFVFCCVPHSAFCRVRVLLRSVFLCSAMFMSCHVNTAKVIVQSLHYVEPGLTLYILTKLKCRPRPCPQPLLPWGGGMGAPSSSFIYFVTFWDNPQFDYPFEYLIPHGAYSLIWEELLI